MEHDELYEKLRVILNYGSVTPFPKHKATHKLLTNLFNEEEAKILVLGLKKVHTPVNIDQISKLVGLPKSELLDKLNNMAFKGLITKVPPEDFMSLPYYPGIIPNYYIYKRADAEDMKLVSEANHELMELSWIQELGDRKYSNFRVIPAIKPMEKVIEINETIETERKVLPFELLKEHVSKIEPQIFSVVPCACRDLAKLAENPCERTDENYCIAAGTWAADLNAQRLGREVSVDELMSIFENSEKAGLVHQTANIQGKTNIICNCCSCCCLYLKSFKETGGALGTAARSNFIPERNNELCIFCEECIQICPTGAIYHHYPHRKDGTDDYMMIRSELCLGCGVCASNCPNEAISLKKVNDIEPSKDYMEMVGRISEGRTH